jgi:hypothetical protein
LPSLKTQHHMMQNAAYRRHFCTLNVMHLENLISDMQSVLGLYQQWTKHPKYSFWAVFL